MACQHPVEGRRLRCLLNLHTTGVSKLLQVLVPVSLVPRQLVSKSLHSRLLEPPGLAVSLRMKGCGQTVFEAQYSANGIEESGCFKSGCTAGPRRRRPTTPETQWSLYLL